MKIAAAYIRVSTDDQTELSPASQLKEVREWAKRNDYIIPDEFIFQDDGISGRNAKKRPQFIKMIATAKSKPKPFDAVIVWKFSRFARSREDSIVYKSQLKKLDISVVSVSEPITDDKMSIIVEGLIESMDEYYSANLSQEVKRGMVEKFSRKQAVTAPPYGYYLENSHYVPKPGEAEIIKEIFERFVNGESAFKISKDLNSRGITTKHGNIVERRTVQYYLENPVYIGAMRYTPDGAGSRNRYSDGDYLLQENCHTPIVSNETFNAAQEIIKNNKRIYGSARSAHTVYEYALKGIVKCSECGHNLTFSSKKDKSPRLHCPMYFHNKCSSSNSVTIKAITTALIDDMMRALNDNNLEIDYNFKKSNHGDSAILNLKLSRANDKLKRIKEAYAAGIDTLSEYKENKIKIQNEIDELTRKLSQSTAKITEAEKKRRKNELKEKLRTAVKMMQSDTATEKEKNAMLHSFISHSSYNSKTKTLSVFYYA